MTSVPQHLATAATRALDALLRGDNLDGVTAVEDLRQHERELVARAARRLVELTA